MAISLWAQPLAKDDCQLKWIRSLGLCFISRETRSVWEWRLWYQIYSDIFWYVLICSDILYTIYTDYILYLLYIYIYTMISLDMFSFWSAEQVEPALQEVITSLVKSSPGPAATCVNGGPIQFEDLEVPNQPPPPQPIHNPLIFESTSCKLDVLDAEFSSFFVCVCVWLS